MARSGKHSLFLPAVFYCLTVPGCAALEQLAAGGSSAADATASQTAGPSFVGSTPETRSADAVTTAADTAQVVAEVAALARLLDHDLWRPAADWPVLDADGAIGDHWRFGERVLEGSPGTTDDIATAVAHLLDAPGGTAALRQLALQPTRSGRNATIVSALRNPQPADTALTTQLRALVLADDALSDAALSQAERAATPDAAVPLPVRAAAAEAWCRTLGAEDDPAQALAEPAQLWTQPALPEPVRLELLRNLARHLPPAGLAGLDGLLADSASSPHFTSSANSTSWRRVAVEGCAAFAATHRSRPYSSDDWPIGLETARFDHDAAVRRAYGRTLAAAQHPEAVRLLAAQLHDTDASVAAAAAISLAIVQTPAAAQLLRTIATGSGERTRAGAVTALAAWGPDELATFATDESPSVRRAAIAGLARWPSGDAALLLAAAVTDADLEVQSEAVAAVAAWPDEFALPVLISAFQTAALRTRQEALIRLRQRTGITEPLPVSGTADERATALQAVAAQHGWPVAALTGFRLQSAATASAAPAASPEVTALLNALSDASPPTVDGIITQLTALPPSDATAEPDRQAIEAYCVAHPGRTAQRLREQVLPRLSPAYAAVAELANDDVAFRRRAAGRLATLAASATLPPVVLTRLYDHLTRETDDFVWRQALAAVAADATPAAGQIALLAVHHPVADIRRGGCEVLGRHALPQQAAWLVPLLRDESRAVQLAAIDAIGRCQNAAIIDAADPATDPAGSLRLASADPDADIRFAAAVALARLGDAAGRDALLRSAGYEAAAGRTAAIHALAELRLPEVVPQLRRLCRSERDPLVQRDLLAALETLVPPAARPPGADAATTAERLAAWAAQ